MALWWNASPMELSEAVADIGEWKEGLANSLTQNGFTQVRNTAQEVAGGIDNCWVSIAYLFNSGRSFWQVVMTAGDPGTTAEAVTNNVLGIISNIKVL